MAMNWENIVGQEQLVFSLKDALQKNRVSHAQLFVGTEGHGTMPLALAFAKDILKKEKEDAGARVEKLQHLDLHLSFPVFKTDTKRKGLTSEDIEKGLTFQQHFRQQIIDNPYLSMEQWTESLNAENRQLQIYADEIDELNRAFSLKSYEGGSKILIIWRADKMNDSASNKLLKFLEEPPKDTYIFLTAEREDQLLPTILSRCQTVVVPRIEDNALFDRIMEKADLDENKVREVVHAAQGNYNTVQQLLAEETANSDFEQLFVTWVRNAFQAKTNPQILRDILNWASTISSWNRERQKKFLDFCAETFRLALLQNYAGNTLVYKKLTLNNFKWEAFSNFIHGANIEDIIGEISLADLHLSRNANAKIVWTDLGIKLTRFLHQQQK